MTGFNSFVVALLGSILFVATIDLYCHFANK